jgi:hypothetical protein
VPGTSNPGQRTFPGEVGGYQCCDRIHRNVFQHHTNFHNKVFSANSEEGLKMLHSIGTILEPDKDYNQDDLVRNVILFVFFKCVCVCVGGGGHQYECMYFFTTIASQD